MAREADSLRLYTYWRSSAAYRVRIALNVKGLSFDAVPVHLVRGGGEQHLAAYREVNPNAVVPTMGLPDGRVLTQSLAIIEYLEETYPDPPLLPEDRYQRARIRAASQLIACDIHPINNLRVTSYLKSTFGRSQTEILAWMHHWMRSGLEAYAAGIDRTASFSFGSEPTLADLCLVPQLYNARRWALDLSGLERLAVIESNCLTMPEFRNAIPEQQADAEM